MPIERRHDGIVDSDGRFYSWSYLKVTPDEVAAATEAASDDVEWDAAVAEAEAAKQAQLEAMKPNYPGKWIEHDGAARWVRGYPNGRYGYWREDGEFVDMPGSL